MKLEWTSSKPTEPGTYLKRETGRTLMIDLVRGDWQSRQNPDWLYTKAGELVSDDDTVGAPLVCWYGPIPPVPTVFSTMEDDS